MAQGRMRGRDSAGTERTPRSAAARGGRATSLPARAPVAPAARGRRRRDLTRDRIVATALRAAERDGLDAVTFRSVARELGVSPAAIHWHLDNREQLLAAIANEVFKDFLAIPETRGSWRAQATAFFTWLRAKLLARAKLLGAAAVQGILPYALSHAGIRVSAILASSGLGPDALERGTRALFSLAFGFMIHEAMLREAESSSSSLSSAVEFALEAIAPADLPAFLQTMPRANAADPERLFAQLLDCFLDGLEDLR